MRLYQKNSWRKRMKISDLIKAQQEEAAAAQPAAPPVSAVIKSAVKPDEILRSKARSRIRSQYTYDTLGFTNRAYRIIQEAISLLNQLDNIEEGVARSSDPPPDTDILRRERSKARKTLLVGLKRLSSLRAAKIAAGVKMEQEADKPYPKK
jgi:hypothetical protein